MENTKEFINSDKILNLNQLKDLIMNGNDLTTDKISKEYPKLYQKYKRTLEAIQQLKNGKTYRNFMTNCIWYYGTNRIEKSHEIYNKFENESYYNYKSIDNDWWDNYKGEDTVIINEFVECLQISTLIEIIDKWPCEVRRRRKSPIPFMSKTVIIISALHPRDCYKKLAPIDIHSLDQLYRRIKIIKLDGIKEIDETIFITTKSIEDKNLILLKNCFNALKIYNKI